jgi:hypothetical protein
MNDIKKKFDLLSMFRFTFVSHAIFWFLGFAVVNRVSCMKTMTKKTSRYTSVCKRRTSTINHTSNLKCLQLKDAANSLKCETQGIYLTKKQTPMR